MMSRQITQGQRCNATEHDSHLCRLTEQYYHVREPAHFREMVLTPQFKCDFCGRTAANAHNLCYPRTL